MGSLIDACGLSEAGIKRQLVTACEANGLIRDDGLHAVERTIGSGLRAGRTQPRKPPAVAQ
jgi:hypothetical protein